MAEPRGGQAMVATRRVAFDEMPPLTLTRSAPTDEQDSGWVAFAGDEDEAYLANPANFCVIGLSTLIVLDPTIAPLLDTPAPCAFQRKEWTHPWQRVDDEGDQDPSGVGGSSPSASPDAAR
jgi:hypothetical protein